MRSLSSILIDLMLIVTRRKTNLSNPEKFNNRIKHLLEVGEGPYVLDYKHFKVQVESHNFLGHAYIVLNGGGLRPSSKIMYFHGGGFISQPTHFHWRFLDQVAYNTQSEIWIPIYPKIPYHTAVEAYEWLLALYSLFTSKIREEKIIFMGDSAGGNLVLGMAQKLKKTDFKQADELIMISPFLDVSASKLEANHELNEDYMLGLYGTRMCGKLWAGSLTLEDPLVSPLYGDIDGLGKMTLFIGSRDLIYKDTQRLIHKGLDQAIPIHLYEFPKMQHVFPLLPIREAKKARGIIEGIVM